MYKNTLKQKYSRHLNPQSSHRSLSLQQVKYQKYPLFVVKRLLVILQAMGLSSVIPQSYLDFILSFSNCWSTEPKQLKMCYYPRTFDRQIQIQPHDDSDLSHYCHHRSQRALSLNSMGELIDLDIFIDRQLKAGDYSLTFWTLRNTNILHLTYLFFCLLSDQRKKSYTKSAHKK